MRFMAKATLTISILVCSNAQSFAEPLENYVFSIHRGEIGTPDFRGTGFIIEQDGEAYGVTAQHVLKSRISGEEYNIIDGKYSPDHPNFFIQVGERNGKAGIQISETIRCPNPNVDICIFQINTFQLSNKYPAHARFKPSCSFSKDERVVTFGFDKNSQSLVGPIPDSVISVNSDAVDPSLRFIARTQAATEEGLSGSPVVITNTSTVIGVHTGNSTSSQYFTTLGGLNGAQISNNLQFECTSSDVGSGPSQDLSSTVKSFQIALTKHNCRSLDVDGKYGKQTELAVSLFNLTGAKSGCNELSISKDVAIVRQNLEALKTCPEPACGNTQQGIEGTGWAKELGSGCSYFETGKYATEYAIWDGACNAAGRIEGYGTLSFYYMDETKFRENENTNSQYKGNTADGYRSGEGTMRFTPKSVMQSEQGTFRNNEFVTGMIEYKTGMGRYLFGPKYKFDAELSEFTNQIPDGWGTAKKEELVVYVGNVVNDRFDGLGVWFKPGHNGNIAAVGNFDSPVGQVNFRDSGILRINLNAEHPIAYYSRDEFPRYEVWPSTLQNTGQPNLWYHCPNSSRSSCKPLSPQEVPEEFQLQLSKYIKIYQDNIWRFD